MWAVADNELTHSRSRLAWFGAEIDTNRVISRSGFARDVSTMLTD